MPSTKQPLLHPNPETECRGQGDRRGRFLGGKVVQAGTKQNAEPRPMSWWPEVQYEVGGQRAKAKPSGTYRGAELPTVKRRISPVRRDIYACLQSGPVR